MDGARSETDQSQAACCAERSCAVVTMADGSTGNTPEALNRLNSACALTGAFKRVNCCGLTGGKHEISNDCGSHSACRTAR